MKDTIIEKFSTLITTAFGLVAALAWNEAIKALFVGPCDVENAGALCSLASGGPWLYAIIVTIVAVATTMWISKIAVKAKETLDISKIKDVVNGSAKTTKKTAKKKTTKKTIKKKATKKK